MTVRYIDSKKTFLLQTRNSAYQMKISEYGYLLHLYYGERCALELEERAQGTTILICIQTAAEIMQ